MAKQENRRLLLGLGLDGKDGHTRLTTGENFCLAGGSKETHAQMQEKTIKLNEHLKKSGKSLDTVSKQELMDVVEKVGLKSAPQPESSRKNRLKGLA